MSKMKYRLNSKTAHQWCLVAWSLAVQLLLVGRHIDNQIISNYAPTAADAKDYFRLAGIWKSLGFTEAFSDGMRMPGYPTIVYIFEKIFGDYTPFSLRLLHILSFAIIQISIFKILKIFCRYEYALILTMIFPLLPTWHFIPVLTAETLIVITFIYITYILLRLSQGKATSFQLYQCALVASIAVYLKPNSVLVVVSACVYLFLKNGKTKTQNLVKFLTIFVISLLPWLIFMQVNQNTISLTTGSGINLLIGTGRDVEPNGTVLSSAANVCNVADNRNPENELSSPLGLSASEVDTLHRETTIKIWRTGTQNQICFGVQKVLITFGFKANSTFDLLYGLISGFTLLVSIAMIKSKSLRPLGGYFISQIFLLSLQAFVFQVDRRFTVPFILPMFIICVAVALGKFSFGNIQSSTDVKKL